MIPPKTHFEQVPLETVRKIVADQILRKIATEKDPKVRPNSLLESQVRTLESLLECSS
jgi:hypothetical protein